MTHFNEIAVRRWINGAPEEEIKDLKEINLFYSTHFEVPNISNETKKVFSSHVLETFSSNRTKNELKLLQLELLKIIFRDKKRTELDCFIPITSLLINVVGLQNSNENISDDKKIMFEAEKCLINLLFNSYKSRAIFEKDALDFLIERISKIQNLKSSNNSDNFGYLKHFNESELDDLYFYDHKISFITSAYMSTIQKKWVEDNDTIIIFFNSIKESQNSIKNFMESGNENNKKSHWHRVLCEALKILFNIYCHAKIFDSDIALKCAFECTQIVQESEFDFELKQNAVNLLATMPTLLNELCPKLTNKELDSVDPNKLYENYDMRFVDSLLKFFEEAIDKVIPPLTAHDVENPPEKGDTLRNKVIRIIQGSSNCHDLAAEFLFVLCKRSVNRLIKYCGFGHSAGLLANYGFLGSATVLKRSESDSEDSETEDYKGVEEQVNPVTGFIPPAGLEADFKRAIDSMSDEQKEFEAMKLVNAMSKLMDQGVIAPGTIGPDGKPKKVAHVAELVKDVPEQTHDSESE